MRLTAKGKSAFDNTAAFIMLLLMAFLCFRAYKKEVAPRLDLVRQYQNYETSFRISIQCRDVQSAEFLLHRMDSLRKAYKKL